MLLQENRLFMQKDERYQVIWFFQFERFTNFVHCLWCSKNLHLDIKIL